jgi:hypothetical protein
LIDNFNLGVSLRWRFGPGCCEPSPRRGLGHPAAIPDATAIAAFNSGVRARPDNSASRQRLLPLSGEPIWLGTSRLRRV